MSFLEEPDDRLGRVAEVSILVQPETRLDQVALQADDRRAGRVQPQHGCHWRLRSLAGQASPESSRAQAPVSNNDLLRDCP